jgi:hypothetical protein
MLRTRVEGQLASSEESLRSLVAQRAGSPHST